MNVTNVEALASSTEPIIASPCTHSHCSLLPVLRAARIIYLFFTLSLDLVFIEYDVCIPLSRNNHLFT